MFLFIHKYFLPAGRKQSYFIEMILTDNSERLNSMIAGRKICRIKFHRRVEFKFAIKLFVKQFEILTRMLDLFVKTV